MTVSLLQSPLFGSLFGDPELNDLMSDARFVKRMVIFERMLARSQGKLGIIPQSAAESIDQELDDLHVPPESLATGVVSAGVPVPALVSELRARLGQDAGQWVHWGATSQDVIDTAQVLGLSDVLRIIDARLTALINALQKQSEVQAETLMAGRTRGQISTPITFGLRIAQWAAPLIELERTLDNVRAGALKVQFGGASGANTAVAPNGSQIAAALAVELGLAAAPPWHTNRLGLCTVADWLLHLTDATAKMAGDLILMMRSEVGEARAGTSGGSSTMPQKQNPVTAETICALAAMARAAHAGLMASGAHAEERDGTKWPVEWTLLPQLLVIAGAALRHAVDLANTLQADAAKMRSTLESNTGVMAEQACFALAMYMPRTEAQSVVKQAMASGKPFADALADLSPVALDWASILDPATSVPAAMEVARQIFANR